MVESEFLPNVVVKEQKVSLREEWNKEKQDRSKDRKTRGANLFMWEKMGRCGIYREISNAGNACGTP
jgi:hypothetical protein